MKNKWTFIILIIVIFLMCLLYVWVGSHDQETIKTNRQLVFREVPKERIQGAIKESGQFISRKTPDTRILKKAKDFSGLGSSGVWGTPTLISGEHLKIPFVGKFLKEKKIWCVNVTGAVLEINSKNNGKLESLPLKLTILLDHESGQIIKINAIVEKGSTPQHTPKASIASAERQMQNVCEIYTGFPKKVPTVNFHDALKSVYNGFGGNPLEASEIEAVYVMQSHLRKEARAVWAITLYGISPFSTFGGDDDSVPVSQRNHLRSIVDAKTGKLLSSTTVPQP